MTRTTPNLHTKAAALAREAAFIGIIHQKSIPLYQKVASAHIDNYTALREVFHIEKSALVREYDHLLSRGELRTLESKRFEQLYRAKYLKEPRQVAVAGDPAAESRAKIELAKRGL